MESSNTDLSDIRLSIDKQGVWRHEGLEITHQRTWKLFSKVLDIDSEGRYFVAFKGEFAYVKVEDAPYVVDCLRLKPEGIRLLLTDGTYEILDPRTLRFNPENVPYCRVRQGRMEARFSRTAYYELVEYIEQSDGGFTLVVNGERFRLPVG